MKTQLTVSLLLGLALTLTSNSLARNSSEREQRTQVSAAASPAYCNVAHNVGRINLTVSNDGTIGLNLAVEVGNRDCFTGQRLLSCEYPIGERTQYLWGGAFWIGAVVGGDTLVSTGADGWSRQGSEFHPDEYPLGGTIYRSTLDPTSPAALGAVSEQDFVARYFDTCTICFGAISPDFLDNRYHQPLNIEVTQKTYAWSHPVAEDFVLFDYSIRNIGDQRLEAVYMGIYADADIHAYADDQNGAQDDLTGYISDFPNPFLPAECSGQITDMALAWAADNEGDLSQQIFKSVPHVTGTRVLRTPAEELQVSFNWWISNGNASLDYGPQRRSNFRDFGTGGTGTPEGDRNKYFLLSNGDIDYDQARVSQIGSDHPIWLPPPPSQIQVWSYGLDTRYLLSFGPFDIDPGETLPVTFAYVAGENLHTDPANVNNLYSNPDAYYNNLDFTDLITNAVWADWVYDNPGVDTDGDGYFGEQIECIQGSDTTIVWVKGDGVPDYRVDGPPPPPTVWVESLPEALHLRWNGHLSETTFDAFTSERDFEGYHAYLSQSGAPGTYALVGAYDVVDYYRYHWNIEKMTWDQSPIRFLLEELVCRYGASCDDHIWDPLLYGRSHPLITQGDPDSVFYFEQLGPNAARFGVETPFSKTYPAAPKAPFNRPAEVLTPDDSLLYLTDDGYFKYYEYEFTIDNLLPEHSYSVAITSFDYRSPLTGIAFESPIAANAQMAVTAASDCCKGTVGNANCDPDDKLSIADIAAIVDHLFISQNELCCLAEADVNRSGGDEPMVADITLGDVALLVDHLFISGQPLAGCAR